MQRHRAQLKCSTAKMQRHTAPPKCRDTQHKQGAVLVGGVMGGGGGGGGGGRGGAQGFTWELCLFADEGPLPMF